MDKVSEAVAAIGAAIGMVVFFIFIAALDNFKWVVGAIILFYVLSKVL